MKTRYTLSIILMIIILSLIVLISISYKVVLCEDKIINLADCQAYLNEKYSQFPAIEHFLEKYNATGGLGLKLSMLSVDSVSSTVLEEKRFASIEINLKDSSIIYQCQDLALLTNSVLANITNPTIEDIDKNDCWEKENEN